MDEPLADQWPYHAVADVILAHSFLRSLPEVDADRIGVTGISWGGYLTCIVSGLDDRFKFAVPVYGCGFLGDNSVWVPQLKTMGAKGKSLAGIWDPSHFLPNGQMPKLWVTGTNDFAYPMDSLRKSYRAAGGDRPCASACECRTATTVPARIPRRSPPSPTRSSAAASPWPASSRAVQRTGVLDDLRAGRRREGGAALHPRFRGLDRAKMGRRPRGTRFRKATHTRPKSRGARPSLT